MGIIERIDNVQQFMGDHEACSFLPHMAIFKPEKQTTKVRVVYLSNLCEPGELHPNAVSHNQALLPGPCLNNKICTTVMMSRFNRYMLTFDIKKAFLNIALPIEDQNRLLSLWFRDVENGDYSIIAFRNKRVSFGLRSSPAILMPSLYRLLVLDIENDPPDIIEFKKLIYHLIYMDNGCISCNDLDYLSWAYDKLSQIFGDYQFELQQFVTNNQSLQTDIDRDWHANTDKITRYFGIQWDRVSDTLSPDPVDFDIKSDTKRKVLSNHNAVYDILNVYGPMFNRAKIYMQKLQQNKALDWDTKLTDELKREWTKIAKQVNSIPCIRLPRFVGSQSGKFDLVVFSDASSSIYGVVVYIVDCDNKTVSFFCAKNRVVNHNLSRRIIPSSEFQGVTYATELLIDLYNELCSDKCVIPLNINKISVFTDSMVWLSWLRSEFLFLDKMNKKSTYVKNRLEHIRNFCNTHPVSFHYVAGKENPADYISRLTSYKQLNKSDYFSGPNYVIEFKHQPDISVTCTTCPSPVSRSGESTLC